MTKQTAWQQTFSEKLPLMGHRNWIVITDMAYPLQTKEGIITLFAEEPYEEVLDYVVKELQKAPHIYAHAYRDAEFNFLKEDLCPGIEEFKQKTNKILSASKDSVVYEKHENLIAKLNDTGKLFQIVIIKTNLTKPYTSLFFELDCKYWDTEKQKQLKAVSK